MNDTTKPKIWVPGDWNAFFGFGTNILVNLLTLSGLLLYVLKMPPDMVFQHILPAAGMMMCMSTFYYAYLAYKLAKTTGRTDVCALPTGISVPHMFIVTLVIMLPIKLATGDPMKAWQAGLVWVFIQSFVLMAGEFLAPIVRRITPKAALLGALAMKTTAGVLTCATPASGSIRTRSARFSNRSSKVPVRRKKAARDSG